MNRSRLTLAAFVIASWASACSRPPALARGGFELSAQPTVVRFEAPVLATGTAWELCFEFDRPGDSHEAEHIQAVLLTAQGERHALTEVEPDRRGESVVCLEGRTTGVSSGDGATTPQAPVRYEAVELSTSVPVRVRELRGGPRP